jgi:glutathione reductase (NADPH)
MYAASMLREQIHHDAVHYEFGDKNGDNSSKPAFNWTSMKEKRDKYITRLNNIYLSGLEKAGCTVFEGWASFVDPHTVNITMNDGSVKTVTADIILIAVGGKPIVPEGDGVAEHCITSDGFFDLTEQPEKVVVVGAGYIAVELAGVLNGLGSETHLVVRKHQALRDFDPDVSDFLDSEMVRQGIIMHRNTSGVASVTLDEHGKKTVTCISGEVITGVDVVLVAPGRSPNVDLLHLEATVDDIVPNVEGLNLAAATGIQQRPRNQTIVVDDWQQTSCANIVALGDVCGQVELTPMAIAGTCRMHCIVAGSMNIPGSIGWIRFA